MSLHDYDYKTVDNLIDALIKTQEKINELVGVVNQLREQGEEHERKISEIYATGSATDESGFLHQLLQESEGDDSDGSLPEEDG